jgi:TatD DNase family protein
MVVVGTDADSSREAVALAARHADVRATVGLHPHEASRFADEWPALLELAGEPGVVAVGEAGFDLHYRHSEPDGQDAAFRAQIRLAHELDRALVIHSREAWDDTFRVLEEETPPARTVFHCFTGGPAEAERALELGTYLSFSGIVSFRGADDVRAAAASCPADRMHVVAVGAALAAAVGRPADAVAAATVATARAVLEAGPDPRLA